MLIFAVGGGYDIVSVHLMAEIVNNHNPEYIVELAGLQNPKFQHFFLKNGTRIEHNEVVCISDEVTAIRYYRAHDYFEPMENRTYEEYVCSGEQKEWVDDRISKITPYKMYSVSALGNMEVVLDFLAQYETVLFCDVGGDVLYAGEENKEVKTPYMDAYSMMLLRKLQRRKPHGTIKLFVIAPGADMELSEEHLLENINRVKIEGASMKIDADMFNKVYKMYLEVAVGKSGKTLRRMNDVINGYNQYDLGNYRKYIPYIQEVSVDKVIEMNPLSKANSFDEILNLFCEINKL